MTRGDQAAATASAEAVVAQMRTGDTRLLGRAISMVENGTGEAAALLAACERWRGTALKIGVTGPPGAGKSTLVDQMALRLRAQGRTVGILAVDPTSPYSGGALLGDRIRMQGFAGDAGVYIRSMASRGAHGGLAATSAAVCQVLEAAGRDVLLIETMGVGQDEIDVVRLADVTVLVLVPGMGDDVQSLKAGVMEVADLYVVNKADRGGAEQVEAEVLAMQALSPAVEGEWVAPVLHTEATNGKGVSELLDKVEEFARRQTRSGAGRPVAAGGGVELRLDHLGIAVRSLDAARSFYESLGLRVTHTETVEHEQVHTAMLPLGESRIELLEPTAEDSTIGRYLAKRGEGLHHIAVHAGDLDAVFARLKADGVRLTSETIRIGAGGHRYFFIHPASTGGVLLEMVGDAAAGGR